MEEKAENWWNADLEGRMENLAVEGAVTVAASGSKNPDREADHWQSSAASTKEAQEKVRNEAEGDNIMCKVEEQQAARVEVQGPKRRAAKMRLALCQVR